MDNNVFTNNGDLENNSKGIINAYAGHCFGLYVDDECVAVFRVEPYEQYDTVFTLTPPPPQLICAVKGTNDPSISKEVVKQLKYMRTNDPNYFWDCYTWRQMTPEDQAQWALLGWTMPQWDGLVPDTPNTDTDWNDLTDAQRQAAQSLGFTKKTWNSPRPGDAYKSGNPNDYYSRYNWDDFDVRICQLWEELGMTKVMWTANQNIDKSWSELTADQQNAATQLGYMQQTWDTD